MNEITINLDQIFNFIHDSNFRIVDKLNCKDEDVLICIPNYLIDLIIRQHLTSNPAYKKPNGDIFIFGIKVQIAYENAITIFYNGYLPTQIIKYTQQL